MVKLFGDKKKTEKLKGILYFLNRVPHINEGGCGVSALSIYRWMKRNGYDLEGVRFVYAYREKYGAYSTNCEYIKGKRSNPTSASHILLSIPKKFKNGKVVEKLLDSHGCFSRRRSGYAFHHYFDEEVVVKSLNQINAWNECFNRHNINEIEYVLNINLSDVSRKQPVN